MTKLHQERVEFIKINEYFWLLKFPLELFLSADVFPLRCCWYNQRDQIMWFTGEFWHAPMFSDVIKPTFGLWWLFPSPFYLIYSSTTYWGSFCALLPAEITAANLLYWYFPAASSCIILINCPELIPDFSPRGRRIFRLSASLSLRPLYKSYMLLVPLERKRLHSGTIIRTFPHPSCTDAGRSGWDFIDGVLSAGHSWPTSTKNDWWQNWFTC